MYKFKSCLLVDDEVEILEAMKAGVDFLFERVDTCTDGRQAFELCTVNKYDLVISDLQMPVMNGVELLKSLRDRENFTPLIFVSGNATKEQISQAELLGAVAYFEKPFDFELFINKVQDVLRKRIPFEAIQN